MRSVIAVFLGLILALVISALVVFGILAPLMTVVFGMGDITSSTVFPSVLMLFAAGFAFYFGGMAAGYRAKGYRRLHGAMVGVVASLLSPVFNLLRGQEPFPRIDSGFAVTLLVGFVIVSIGASFLGGGRGGALYRHNESAGRVKAPVGRRKEGSENRG